MTPHPCPCHDLNINKDHKGMHCKKGEMNLT